MSEQTIQPDYEAAIAVWNGYENRGSLRPAIGAAVKPLIEHIEHQSQEIERLAALLNEVREALLKHSQWCGFNPDAPGAEGFRAAMLAASLERDHYRAALERIDQAPLGTDTYAMRVIAQQAIIAYDPEYPNNRRKPSDAD